MKRFVPILPFLFILLAGILGTYNLFHPGFPITHDGDVHLLRLTNFYQVLTEGILIPRWAANVNWGYGQPVFEFFYPLPSYIASFLHLLGISFGDSLKLLLGVSLLFSGLTMYVWLREFLSRWGAFFGAFLYMFAPYRFVDMYVRGDIGESLALIFVPLVLYFISLSFRKKSKYPVLLGGISLAMLILCHNIVSLMTLPFIVFYGIFLWVRNGREKKDLIRITIIIGSGFLLSAFFWLPGLLEGKYTLRDIVTRGEYRQRFVTFTSLVYGLWNYGGSGSFTVQLGIAQWLVVLGSVFLFFIKKYTQKFFLAALLLYTGIAVFLMLPGSDVVWSKIILLQNFQFPWRFLLVTIFSTSVLGALFVDGLPKKFSVFTVIFLVAVSLIAENSYWHAKAYVSRPDSTYAGIFKGPSDTGESSPRWGIRFMESGYTAPLEVLEGKAQVTVQKRTSTLHTYIVSADTTAKLMENTLYFPGWHVFVDGKEVSVEFQNEQHRGLMLFNLSSGKHEISVVFNETKFRLAADYVSLGALIILLYLLLPLPKRFTIRL